MRFIMSSADKATVNALRQQLTTSWGLFSVGAHLCPAGLVLTRVCVMPQTELQMDTNYKVTKADEADDPAEVWKRMFDEMAAKYQIAHRARTAQPNSFTQQPNSRDPYHQQQVPHEPQRQYRDNGYPSQSQAGEPSRPNYQHHLRSNPFPNSPSANSYHSQQPQSVPAPPPPPVSHIGVAGNVNFGTNYGASAWPLSPATLD